MPYSIRIDKVHGFKVVDKDGNVLEFFRVRSDAERFKAHLERAWAAGFEKGKAHG